MNKEITTTAELDALPLESIVASLSTLGNTPTALVWQRGSHNRHVKGWCTPDTEGGISSSDLILFLHINELGPELKVLYEGGGHERGSV